jgi:hypothetical protein
MTPLVRNPYDSWPVEHLAWATGFSDLRPPETLGSHADLRLQLELKTQSLFVKYTVLRDSDLRSNPLLAAAIADNANGVRDAVVGQAILLSIRADAEDFSDANHQVGPNRAFPHRYERAIPVLKRIDSFVDDQAIALPTGSTMKAAAVFRTNLKALLESTVLPESQLALLAEAVDRAEQQARSSLIRFADVYEFLVRRSGLDPFGDVIQWCKAAHVLAVPAYLGVAPLTVDRDVSPAQVRFFRRMPTPALSRDDRFGELLPRRILSDQALLALTYTEIMDLRQVAEQEGYFEAFARARRAYAEGEQSFASAYADYLRSLQEYIERIGVERRVELVPWQQHIARNALRGRAATDALLRFGVPLVMLSGFALLIQSLGLIEIIGGAVATGQGLKFVGEQFGEADPLTKLLDGISISK